MEEENKKKKSIWNNIWNKNKLKKPNKVAGIYLQNNGVAKPMELESKNGFFSINGKTYHEDRDCIYTISKDRIPLVIIPEWSLIPYGTKNWHDKQMLEKFAELQDHTLKGIRHAELVKMSGEGDRMKLNPKVIILGIIVLIVGWVIVKNYL